MDKGLLHPDHEDRMASWFLATFQDAAHDGRASNLSVAYTTHLLWWWVNAAEAFGLDFLFFVSLFVL
jgi:hypothetical protein